MDKRLLNRIIQFADANSNCPPILHQDCDLSSSMTVFLLFMTLLRIFSYPAFHASETAVVNLPPLFMPFSVRMIEIVQ
jgi:hypothetical protein